MRAAQTLNVICYVELSTTASHGHHVVLCYLELVQQSRCLQLNRDGGNASTKHVSYGSNQDMSLILQNANYSSGTAIAPIPHI